MLHHLARHVHGWFIKVRELEVDRIKLTSNGNEVKIESNADGEIEVDGVPVGGGSTELEITPLRVNCLQVNNTSNFAGGQNLISFGIREEPFADGFHLTPSWALFHAWRSPASSRKGIRRSGSRREAT